VTGETEEAVSERQALTRDWSVEQLGPEGLAFVRTFQPTIEIGLTGDSTLLCFHGSPASFDDVLLPESIAPLESFVPAPSVRVLAGGHTHTQWMRPLGDVILFNPGSVGLSYGRRAPEETFRFDPWACYALLHDNDGDVAVEFRHVPYDVERLTDAIKSSGIPDAEAVAAMHQPIAL
jgi:predicted phosphodiesterase